MRKSLKGGIKNLNGLELIHFSTPRDYTDRHIPAILKVSDKKAKKTALGGGGGFRPVLFLPAQVSIDLLIRSLTSLA